jgi:Skp family chaperone for outer membrane proteins
MKSLVRLFWIPVLAIGALMIVGAVVKTNTSMEWGAIDLIKAATECKQGKAAIDEYQAKLKIYSEALNLWNNNRFLKEEDFKTILKIKSDPKALPEQKAIEQKLIDQSAVIEQELADLQNKPKPSEYEKKRLIELTTRARSVETLIKNESGALKVELDNWSSKRRDDLIASCKVTVAQVAKKKGCSVIFLSTVAVYAKNDLTEDVILEMNKKK